MNSHTSVLLNEVIQVFVPCKLSIFLDGTLGAGGHTEAILKAHPEIERAIGIDQDPTALALAEERLKNWKAKLTLLNGNFADFDTLLKKESISQLNGILVDIGVSSMQIDQPERGFSFSKEGSLDMRMDPSNPLTAAEIVNSWSEQEIGKILRDYGEEKKWRLAAKIICEARAQKPILTTTDLAGVLRPSFGWNPKKGINPLTLIFQALRIAVNDELGKLEIFLKKALDALAPGGRLAVISFHSLEDRIVKQVFALAASDKWDTSGIGGVFLDKKPTVLQVTRKPIMPSEEEISKNPRSRSAKLRVVEKLWDS